MNRLRWVLPAAVWSAALGFGCAALLGRPGPAADRAVVDPSATARVTTQVDSTLSRILSYTPQDTTATALAARTLLSGTASAQYQTLFAQVKGQIGSQRLTVTTKVTHSGVVSLTGDQAQLLVFVQQTAQRQGAAASTVDGQLSVTARLIDGQWRISDMTER
jgi:Mce-associated membrane protein